MQRILKDIYNSPPPDCTLWQGRICMATPGKPPME
jgi:hypothetical protein